MSFAPHKRWTSNSALAALLAIALAGSAYAGPVTVSASAVVIKPATATDNFACAVANENALTLPVRETAEPAIVMQPDLNQPVAGISAKPEATAPLPPAVLTGGGMLIGNWMLGKLFKRRLL